MICGHGSFALTPRSAITTFHVDPSSPRVLVADGDDHTRGLLRAALCGDGLRVVTARNSDEATHTMETERPDIAVIDTALEPVDGIELCLRWRSEAIDVPIVFVSKHDDAEARIDALVAGGDVFLVQPVSINELVARVRRILWRRDIAAGQSMRIGDLTIDDVHGEVLHDGKPLELSTTEYRLLRYLLANYGQILTRRQILEAIWSDERVSPKVVDVYVGYLRRKLPESITIRSVRSLGYVLDAPSA
jgi:two-component system OmpR family response regulator